MPSYSILDKNKPKESVKKELEEGREIVALFLIHGYIESILRQMILIHPQRNFEVNKDEINDFDRVNTKTIILLNLILGQIDYELYKRIEALNAKRNIYAHELISIDLSDSKNKEKIGGIVTEGLITYDALFDCYLRVLDKKQKTI